MALLSCSSSLQYVKDSNDFSSFELDYHDMKSVIDKNVKSFINSNLMKKHDSSKKAVIAISNIDNLSDEKIDTEFMGRKFIRKLSTYEQIVITNAIAGNGARADKMIEDSRNLTENENFNQYTTKEKGRILAPEYSLSGKITKSIKNVGKKQRVDYQFLFMVSDLDSGREVWSNDTLISKVIKKEDMGRYSTTEVSNEANKYNEMGWSNYHNSEYGRAKKYFKKACKLGLQEACENLKKAKEAIKEDRISRSFLNSTGSIFGGIVGVDFGIFSGGRANMPEEYLEYDVVADTYFSFPTTTKIGGFYKKDKGLYLELNFLYRLHKVDTLNARFKHSQLGGNLRIGYGNTWENISLIGYAGGGVFFDLDSNIIIKGNYNITKNINGLYPFWELGTYMTYKDKFFAEISFRYVFDGDIDKYWVSSSSFNLGFGVFLSKKLFGY